MKKCSNCLEEHPDTYEWINVMNISIRCGKKEHIDNGEHHFCSISCLNTYLYRLAGDEIEE
jgi:hypothetical protein